MEEVIEGPHLGVVKPGRKHALKDNVDDFLFSLHTLDKQQAETCQITTIMNGVYYIDNVLSKEECSSLCKVVDASDSLNFWSPHGRDNEQIRMYRDADTIEVISATFAGQIWARVFSLANDFLGLEVADDESDANWERELVGKWRPSALNHDLLFAKYPSGGAFAPHTDGRAVHDFNTRSFYSVIVFLNTIPKGSGGGTRFYVDDAVNQLKTSVNSDGKTHWSTDAALATSEVDAVAGRMLIFHQALVHEGMPPCCPHVKYIIRSDVMSARSPALCDSAADREAYAVFKQAEDLAEAGQVDEAMPLFRRAFKMSPEMARIMGQA